MERKFLILLFIFIIISCDYKREQEIPRNIEIISYSENCNFRLFIAKEISLKNIDKSTLSDWQKGLVCEGYADEPRSIEWQEYNSLEYSYRDSFKYFIPHLENCFDVKLDLDNIWMAACITKIRSLDDSYDTKYYRIFILDKKNSNFYEIENLD